MRMRPGLSFRYVRRDWQKRTAQIAKRCLRSFRSNLVLVMSTTTTPHGLEPMCSTGIHAIVDIVITRMRCPRNRHRLRFSGQGGPRFSVCSEQVHTHHAKNFSVWGIRVISLVLANFTGHWSFLPVRMMSKYREADCGERFGERSGRIKKRPRIGSPFAVRKQIR